MTDDKIRVTFVRNLIQHIFIYIEFSLNAKIYHIRFYEGYKDEPNHSSPHNQVSDVDDMCCRGYKTNTKIIIWKTKYM